MITTEILVYTFIALIFCFLVFTTFKWLKKRREASQIFESLPLSISVEGFEIHYIQKGKGPHLVLLHGIGSSIHAWDYIIDDLAAHYKVTALDLPGFGKSSLNPDQTYGLDEQARRVISFLDQLDISQSRLLGCSMGGALALWLARLDPQRFFEVATIAPAIHTGLIPFKASQLHWASPLLRLGVSNFLGKRIMNRVVNRKELVTQDIINRNLHLYKSNSQAIKTFLKATDLIRDPRIPKDLKKIEGRVLVLWGKKDRVNSIKNQEKLKQFLPQAEYYTHPHGGHHLMEDEPQWVVERLKSFFGPQEI